MPEQIRVPVEEARGLCIQAYTRNGVPPEDAAFAAEQFVLCDLFGIHTHGLRRLSHYIGRIELGGINPKPEIRMTSAVPGVVQLDGDGGLGTVIASRAVQEGVQRARDCGIAYVGCSNSNHFGANATYGWMAAREGMVCISATNGSMSMPATGGKAAVVGNNPMGYAAPRKDAPPFLLDFAMSVAARGKLRRAQTIGEPIPEGWGLGKDGQPTTDATAALEGFVLPIGGHKGYGLALATEMLAAILGGGVLGPDLRSQYKQAEQPSLVSHYFILIDPDKTIGRAAFEEKMAAYCDWVKSCPAADPSLPVLVPGEMEAMSCERNTAEGLPMDKEEYERLRGLADGSVKGVVPKA